VQLASEMCLQSESIDIIYRSRSALFTSTMGIILWLARCPTSIALLLLIQIVSTNFTTEASKLKFSTQIQRADVTPSHVFIFGLGYSGLALVSSIKRVFPDCVISGTCRSLDKAENLKKFGIQPFIFDPDVRSNDFLLNASKFGVFMSTDLSLSYPFLHSFKLNLLLPAGQRTWIG
jgi:hypothetical protein